MTVILVLALLLTGCSMTNLAEVLQAAGDDQATVSIQINTIYGTARYCRTGILNGNVVCDSNGITVKSEATQVNLPMMITPQFQLGVGQPTMTPAAPVQVAPPKPPKPQSEAPQRLAEWLRQPVDTLRPRLQDMTP